MLRRLFLSIIILSTLASDGGAYYSVDLIDYYLSNLAHLDIIQDSRNTISSLDSQELNSLEKKGTPISFFKLVSQDSINSKASINLKVSSKHNHLEFLWIYGEIIALSIFITLIICLNIQLSFVTRRALFSRTDSSPPAYC